MTCHLTMEGLVNIAQSVFFGLLVLLHLTEGKSTSNTPDGALANPAFQTLRCYQCYEQANNTLCSRPSDLSTCQNSYRSNVCSTKVSFSPEHGMRITKSCDTGPCSLDSAGALALGFDKSCDKTKPRWSCSACCSGDGCNVNAGSHTQTATATIGILLTYSLLQFAYSHLYQ